VETQGGGWKEEGFEEGTDDDITSAAMTATVTLPNAGSAGEKRTHEQQDMLPQKQRATLPPERFADMQTPLAPPRIPRKPRTKRPFATTRDHPATLQQKRAKLPPGRDANMQEGGGEEKEEADNTAELAELIKKKAGGKGQTSRFLGVSWCKVRNKWRAQHSKKKTNVHLGFFAKEEDAARAFIEFVQHGTRDVIAVQKSSRFRGVSWIKSSGKWVAFLARNLGSFRDEKDAARRYNDEARKLGYPAHHLNVFDDDGDDDGDDNCRDRDHDDTGAASMRSVATDTADAAAAATTTAAAAATPTTRPPTPATTDAQSAKFKEARCWL
jgi:hypothetical protein